MRDAAQRRLAIGFFDGVHLGHRTILTGADAALTFRQHPLSVIAPERAPRLLMSVDERVAAIRACGVADVTVLDFTPELAGMTAEEFVVSFLKRSGDRFSAVKGERFSAVRCGENWRFGKGGRGDAAFLRAHGIDVEVVGYAEWNGDRVSSSRIRRCLADGRVEDAEAMLGRPYVVGGDIVPGKGLGAGLGYPTINVDAGRPLNLRFGVYAVELAGVKGVANYGLAPTAGAAAWTSPVLEVHLLGAVPDGLAGKATMRIVRFVRDERTFATFEDLKRQIAADCAAVAPDDFIDKERKTK